MKIEQFFEKPEVRVSQTPNVFQLGNESREAELEGEIQQLKARLATLLDKEHENIRLLDENKIMREQRINESRELDAIQYEYENNKQALNVLMDIKHAYNQSVQEVKELTGQAEVTQEMIKAMKEHEKEQTNLLEVLNEKYRAALKQKGALQYEYDTVFKQAKIQKGQVDFLTSESKQFQQENTDYVQTIEEMHKTYNESMHHIDYWKATAEMFATQIDEFKNVEFKLTTWIKNLKAQNQHETSKSGAARKRAKKNLQLITEMNSTIEKMGEETKYLQDSNSKLKTELQRPIYNSMGAISRLENFKMSPMGAATNRNKLYLGNGKPTLLKFKPREEIEHDKSNI